MTILGRRPSDLDALGGLWTAREIAQQPAMIRATQELLEEAAPRLAAQLRPFIDDERARVILTGAGSSAFIGECLAPVLDATLKARVEAIATTDIVARPELHFRADAPTLLVSFGRSGSSPESVAAIDAANHFVGNLRHLAFTCNAEGELARRLGASAFLTPAGTNDRSFAMTSSFTSMTYAALAAFLGVDRFRSRSERIAAAVEAMLAARERIEAVAKGISLERAVYLGSGPFMGLAREAALKMLELTDGECVSMFDSPLGLRHGPKTALNARTLVVMFVSNDARARRYDLDLLEELTRERRAGAFLALCASPPPGGIECERIEAPDLAGAADIELLFPYIVAPQILAFSQSLRRGKAPDNPNAAGVVNRVVKGVRIYAVTT